MLREESGGEEAPEPAPPTTSMVLPMQLRVGDRFGDETAQWKSSARHTARGVERSSTRASRGSTNPPAERCKAGPPAVHAYLSENQSSRLLCLFPEKEDSSHFTNLGEELFVLISGEVCHAI